jgi:NADH:ubiquinone oxidoreductase subunit
LHHTVDVPPVDENYQPRPWQKPHRFNLTGTPGAYRPSGSMLASNRRPRATGDYKAWAPAASKAQEPAKAEKAIDFHTR